MTWICNDVIDRNTHMRLLRNHFIGTHDKKKLILEHNFMSSVLHNEYHARWCIGDFGS